VDLAASAAQFLLETSLTECYHWTRQAVEALDATSVGGRREMELQAALAVAEMFTRGNAETVRSTFARSLHLAEQLGDLHWQFWLLRALYIYHMRLTDFQGALHIIEQIEAVARELADPASMLYAKWMRGGANSLIGNHRISVDLCESAMVQNPGSERPSILHLGFDDRLLAMIAFARSLWQIGQPHCAVVAARSTISEAERLGQPVGLSFALAWTIPIFLWMGDWINAESMIDRLIDHTARHFLGPHHAIGIGLQGVLLVQRGDVARGIDHLLRSQASLNALRHRVTATVFATALAEARAQLMQLDEALRLIDEAITQIDESFDMPEMLRIRDTFWLLLAALRRPKPFSSNRSNYRASKTRSVGSCALRLPSGAFGRRPVAQGTREL
jgi:hypothetical protein